MFRLILTMLISIAFCSNVLSAGIYRHDVSEEEYLKFAKEQQFEPVGQFIYKDEIQGSCVLIGNRCVLTAAHVMIESDYINDTVVTKESTTIYYNPVNNREMDAKFLKVKFGELTFNAKKITMHSTYMDEKSNEHFDIALIELEKPVMLIKPAKLNKKFDEAGSDVAGCGFGASGPADKPELVNFYDKKIAGQNVIDTVWGDKYNGKASLLVMDFDHPVRTDCNRYGSNIPKDLEYNTTGGDSGGGLFRKSNGYWELIGISSGSGTEMERLEKMGYYGHLGEWIRVSAFYDWIIENMK